MKAFDIEKAKAGAKVITRRGLPVRILCFDLNHSYPIVAAIGESEQDDVQQFTDGGRWSNCGSDDEYDLLMAPEKRYVAVWLKNNGNSAVHPLTFVSEELARAALYPLSGYQIVEFDV